MMVSGAHGLSPRGSGAFRFAWALGGVLLLAGAPLQAQDENEATPEPAASLASPRDTMMTFLEAMNQADRQLGAWDTALDTLDLGPLIRDPLEARVRAARLLGVINRIERVREDYLWGPDAIPPGATRFVYFPDPQRHADWIAQIPGLHQIALEVTPGGAWLFSRATIEAVPELYRLLEDRERVYGRDDRRLDPSAPIRDRMPLSWRRTWLVMEAWRAVGLFLLILIGLVTDLAVRMLLIHLSLVRARLRHREADRGRLAGWFRPLGLLAAGLVWMGAVRLLGLVGLAELILHASIRVFVTLAAIWSAWRLADLAGEALRRKIAGDRAQVDSVLVPLVRRALKIFIAAIGVVFLAESLNFNLGPFLASLGIGGLAFAFAAKDTIENFFGSVAVLIDRPFAVGDWVVIGGTEGIVEALGFRSTRVRTFYNSQVTIPNASLVRATVDNYGRRQFRRWFTHLNVQYDTPPDRITAFTEGIREIIRSLPRTRKEAYEVWLNDFSESSLDILLVVFFRVASWSEELEERERLCLEILRLAHRLGVSFAFPTRTLHMAPSGREAKSPVT